jgi:hypothetical protein
MLLVKMPVAKKISFSLSAQTAIQQQHHSGEETMKELHSATHVVYSK